MTKSEQIQESVKDPTTIASVSKHLYELSVSMFHRSGSRTKTGPDTWRTRKSRLIGIADSLLAAAGLTPKAGSA